MSTATEIPTGKITTLAELRLVMDAYDGSESATDVAHATNEYWGAYYMDRESHALENNWDGPEEALERVFDWMHEVLSKHS